MSYIDATAILPKVLVKKFKGMLTVYYFIFPERTIIHYLGVNG